MLYFAYGSNMNQNQMKERCSGSSFRVIGRAKLEGYRFVYDGYSTYRKGAVANIIKKEGSIVWGGLYEIDENCLKSLDSYEGYPTFYKRKIILVKDDEGKEYEAWVYLRNPKEIGKPSEDYKKTILEGAKQCNLPDEYIRKYILQENL